MGQGGQGGPEPITGPDRVPELRVHGVGGAHGAKMLGCTSPTDVVTVGEGVGGTRFLARRNDRSVESYDWGDLTGGSGLRSLWIVLLPFTLINIAGWMHPPASRTSVGTVVLIRRLVHALSILLTATFVFSFGVVLVDIVGWQWSRRIKLPNDPARYVAHAKKPLPSTIGMQRTGMFVGLALLAAIVVVMSYLAGKSQLKFEDTPLAPEVAGDVTGDEPWGADESLRSRGFFFHPKAADRRLALHRVVAGVSWLLVAGWSVAKAYGDPDVTRPLDVSRLHAGCSAAALLLILALFIASWRNGRRAGERWVPAAPAIAATLSFGLMLAIFSGTVLLLLKRLNDAPARPDAAPPILAGPEVNLVDGWGCALVVLALVGGIVGGWLWFTQRRPADDVPARTSAPGRPLDGAENGWRTQVATARFLARMAHRGGFIALGLAGGLMAFDVALVAWRSLVSNPGTVFLAAPPPHALKGVWYRIGAYALPGLVLLLLQIVRKSQGGARTVASTLWDVLTFWPRRFSPFAVRAYSERAVPELQGRIAYHLAEHHQRLVLAVHSQGTVISFAALAPLGAEHLRKVAFVTYGSPIRTIYATFFPAYFGTDEVAHLEGKLPPPGDGLLGSRNFYRLTDPIGGPIFGPDDAAAHVPGLCSDCLLDDPYTGRTPPAEDVTAAPLEHDRPLWSQIAVHSYYLQEPELKRWVRDVRLALDHQP